MAVVGGGYGRFGDGWKQNTTEPKENNVMKVWLVQGETCVYGIISAPTAEKLVDILRDPQDDTEGGGEYLEGILVGTDPYVGLVEFEVDQQKIIDT